MPFPEIQNDVGGLVGSLEFVHLVFSWLNFNLWHLNSNVEELGLELEF